jgi:two-component system, NarL family, nitrate/nitrite response regulator NarL
VTPLRVAVVAEALSRRGLERLLEDHELTALPEAEAEAADAILWDGTGPPPLHGPPVLALAPDEAEAGLLLGAGALGVLYRDASDEQVLAALQAVAAGLCVLEPGLAGPLAQTAQGAPAALTPREAEVLGLLAEGLSNKQIARRLELSEHTVKFHLSALLGKFGATTRTELVVRAAQAGRVAL